MCITRPCPARENKRRPIALLPTVVRVEIDVTLHKPKQHTARILAFRSNGNQID
jgi:hypothetical protein